jgi:hypothetical protein
MTTMTTGSSLEHPVGPEGVVSVRLHDGEVRLVAVDGETIRIREAHGRLLSDLFVVDLGQGTAALRPVRGGGPFGRRGHGHAPELEIELPRRATIVVETSSGDVEVVGPEGDQRYRTASGDVALRGVSGRIAIESVSGDIDIVATGSAEVGLRTVSGDVALRAGTLRSLQAATTSGDLKVAGRLTGPGPFSIVSVSGDAILAPAGNVRIEMATLSGDLRSELDGRIEGGRSRRSLTIGSDGPVIEFRSMSGELRVVRPSAFDLAAAIPRTISDDPAAPTSVASPVPAETGPEVANGAIADAYDEARLRILRSLERGEIDVAEAGRRLEALDAGPGALGAPTAPTDGVSRA